MSRGADLIRAYREDAGVEPDVVEADLTAVVLAHEPLPAPPKQPKRPKKPKAEATSAHYTPAEKKAVVAYTRMRPLTFQRRLIDAALEPDDAKLRLLTHPSLLYRVHDTLVNMVTVLETRDLDEDDVGAVDALRELLAHVREGRPALADRTVLLGAKTKILRDLRSFTERSEDEADRLLELPDDEFETYLYAAATDRERWRVEALLHSDVIDRTRQTTLDLIAVTGDGESEVLRFWLARVDTELEKRTA